MDAPETRAGPSRLTKYASCFGVGALIVLALVWGRGIFGETDTVRIYRLLSDGFFLAGVVLTCFGLMTLISREGMFDVLNYGMLCFFSLFRTGRDAGEERQSFLEYRREKRSKRSVMWHLVFSGLVFLAVSLLFVLLFNAASA